MLDEAGNGTLTSSLSKHYDDVDEEYKAAINGVESLILGHAIAGIDIATPAYVEGIETAVDAVLNCYT